MIMNDYRKRYRRMKTINIILVILLIASLAVISCLLTREPEQTPQNHIPAETQEATTEAATAPAAAQTPEETEATAETAAAADDGEWIWIETPYMSLGYPSEWESYLKYDHAEAEGVFTESFYCCIEEELIGLCDVHFGTEEADMFLGYLETENGDVPVSVTFHDYVPDSTWREDDTYVLFAMQESVNDLINKIQENSRFTVQ